VDSGRMVPGEPRRAVVRLGATERWRCPAQGSVAPRVDGAKPGRVRFVTRAGQQDLWSTGSSSSSQPLVCGGGGRRWGKDGAVGFAFLVKPTRSVFPWGSVAANSEELSRVKLPLRFDPEAWPAGASR